MLVVENLRSGLQSSDDVATALGANTLSLVPLLKRSRIRKTVSPEEYVIHRPASSFAESLRSLHTSLLIANAEQSGGLQSVLVTSSLPEEGKTTVSLATARVAASGVQRVLLLDADMRTNRIGELLGLAPVGLGQVLSGKVDVADAIQRDSASNLDVLVAGQRISNPTDLITSTAMRDLLAQMAARYDLIVVDSPPVLAVSDARFLARLTDTTVFVVKWMSTKRAVAGLGFRQLIDAGAQVSGVVLSMVDVRKSARYGYADSGYYRYGYGRYGYGRRYRQYHVE